MNNKDVQDVVDVVVFGLVFAVAVMVLFGAVILIEKIFGLWGVTFVLFFFIGLVVALCIKATQSNA